MPFYGDVIQTFDHDGAYWVAVRRIVENLGMSSGSQRIKILEQKRKFSCVDIDTTGADGKTYEMTSMPTTKLALWLASINPNKVAESVRPKLECYQAESAVALHDYWTKGVVINAHNEMLSLTDMWKAAKSPSTRRPSDWKNDSANVAFLDHVALIVNAAPDGIWQGRRGKNGETFAHWQIGLAYAKYLSPAFHMWCNTVVRERMEGRIVAAVVQDGALMPCRDRRPCPKAQRADGFDPKSTRRPTVDVTAGVFRLGGDPDPENSHRGW